MANMWAQPLKIIDKQQQHVDYTIQWSGPVDGNQKSGKLTSWGWIRWNPIIYLLRVLAPSQVVGLGISEPSIVWPMGQVALR